MSVDSLTHVCKKSGHIKLKKSKILYIKDPEFLLSLSVPFLFFLRTSYGILYFYWKKMLYFVLN